jgi:TusA-related sulfurtransferase
VPPITFLKVLQVLRTINPGDILEIQGNDPDTRQDLFQVLASFPYQLIGIEEKKKSYCIRLRTGVGRGVSSNTPAEIIKPS